jgi:hypothetical protein
MSQHALFGVTGSNKTKTSGSERLGGDDPASSLFNIL